MALIFALGSLTLLLSLGSAFVMNMMGENRQTEWFVSTLRARLAAQAGLERAIAELRREAINTSPAYGAGLSNITGSLGTGAQYVTAVVDGASRINLNDSNTNISSMLQSFSGIGSGTADKVHQSSYGTPYLPQTRYLTKKQLKKIPGVQDAKYNTLKDAVTVSSYQDPNTTNFTQIRKRSPININTASQLVLEAVLKPFLDSKATDVATAIISRRATNPFGTWEEYNAWVATVSGAEGLSDAQENNLRDNMNPNRRHAWSTSNASTEANKYSTEFCFHSGGMYEISSQGQALDSAGNVRANLTVTATTRIYSLYNMTTKEQFRGEDINSNWALDGGEDVNGNGLLERPEYLNVTWADDCPVNSNDETPLGYVSGYDKVNDALKLGFWDNFEDKEFSETIWVNEDTQGSDYEIENSDTRNNIGEKDNDNELHHTSTVPVSGSPAYYKSRFGVMKLSYGGSWDSWNDKPYPAWVFPNAYIRADVIEDTSSLGTGSPDSGHDDVAWLGFRAAGTVAYQAYARHPGINYYKVGAEQFQPSSIYQDYPLTEDGWNMNSDGYPINWDNQGEIREQDDSTLPTPLIEGPVVNDIVGTSRESRIILPDRVVFVLGRDPPPDENVSTGVRGDGQDLRRAPYQNEWSRTDYVMGGKAANRYQYYPRRTFRIYTINRIVIYGYLPGVRMQLSQEAPGGAVVQTRYPIDNVDGSFYSRGDADVSYFFGPEINTFINTGGTIKLQNHGSFPSWDNVRVITPMGKYQSPVIDAGTDKVYWGMISWTATTPASADPDRERVSFEPESFITKAQADGQSLHHWSYSFPRSTYIRNDGGLFDGYLVGSGQALAAVKGRIQESGSKIADQLYWGSGSWGGSTYLTSTEVDHKERFLRFHVWLTSERFACNAADSDPSLDDPDFLRETPVLEDVTVTYVTPTRIMAYREGG